MVPGATPKPLASACSFQFLGRRLRSLVAMGAGAGFGFGYVVDDALSTLSQKDGRCLSVPLIFL